MPLVGLRDYASITLLHELGHGMVFLFGANASAIKKDTELTDEGRKQSKANTELIKKKCFSKKKK